MISTSSVETKVIGMVSNDGNLNGVGARLFFFKGADLEVIDGTIEEHPGFSVNVLEVHSLKGQVRDDILEVDNSNRVRDKRVVIFDELLVTDTRRAEVHEDNLGGIDELSDFKNGEGSKSTTQGVTSDEDLSSGVLGNQTGNASVDFRRDFLKSLLETIVNETSLAFSVVNGNELEVGNPVLDVAATTISDDDTVVNRVITTITLSFLGLVVEGLDFSHTRVVTASRTAIPFVNSINVTVRSLGVVIDIDGQIRIEGRGGQLVVNTETSTHKGDGTK